jgi:hypothetical protein
VTAGRLGQLGLESLHFPGRDQRRQARDLLHDTIGCGGVGIDRLLKGRFPSPGIRSPFSRHRLPQVSSLLTLALLGAEHSDGFNLDEELRTA